MCVGVAKINLWRFSTFGQDCFECGQDGHDPEQFLRLLWRRSWLFLSRSGRTQSGPWSRWLGWSCEAKNVFKALNQVLELRTSYSSEKKLVQLIVRDFENFFHWFYWYWCSSWGVGSCQASYTKILRVLSVGKIEHILQFINNTNNWYQSKGSDIPTMWPPLLDGHMATW